MLVRQLYGEHFNPVGQLKRKSTVTPYWIDTINGKTLMGGVPPRIEGPSASLHIQGWAIDGDARDAAGGVILLVDGTPYVTHYGLWRDDVALALDAPQYRELGFTVDISLTEIGTGTHTICIQIVSKDRTAYYQPEDAFHFSVWR